LKDIELFSVKIQRRNIYYP